MKKFIVIIVILLTGLSIGIITLSSQKNNQENTNSKNISYESKITDIKFNDKVNIYLFYGKGCPHCEALFTYFDSIKSKYYKYYNLYAFEVWYNEDNGKIMDYFLEKFDKKVSSRSVPFLIIGDEAFEGYSSSMNQKIIDTIEEKYKDRDNIKDFSDVLNI